MTFMKCDHQDCAGELAQIFKTRERAEVEAENHFKLYGHSTRTSSGKTFQREDEQHVTTRG